MRPNLALAAVLVLAGVTASAQAEKPPIQETGLPPLQAPSRSPDSPPAVRAPVPSGITAPSAAAPEAQKMPPAALPATADRPNTWVPAGVAKLQALDKVNAQTAELTIKVGQSATFGSLTIAVKSCVIRPADQPADAAAYLDVTDSHADSPGFDGWMLRAEPSVSMMQHPIYDLRVTGCA